MPPAPPKCCNKTVQNIQRGAEQPHRSTPRAAWGRCRSRARTQRDRSCPEQRMRGRDTRRALGGRLEGQGKGCRGGFLTPLLPALALTDTGPDSFPGGAGMRPALAAPHQGPAARVGTEQPPHPAGPRGCGRGRVPAVGMPWERCHSVGWEQHRALLGSVQPHHGVCGTELLCCPPALLGTNFLAWCLAPLAPCPHITTSIPCPLPLVSLSAFWGLCWVSLLPHLAGSLASPAWQDSKGPGSHRG